MGDGYDRRRSLGAAALDAAELGTGGAASAPSGTSGPAAATITAGANTSLGALTHYRWRLGLAEGGPRFVGLEQRPAAGPRIAVPTITLEGDANGAPHADRSAYASKFSGRYAHRRVEGGIGHNLPQEAPQAFAAAVVDVDGR